MRASSRRVQAKNGGYVLARKPSEITLGQILNAFDNDLKHVRQPMKRGAKASESALAVREVHGMIMDSLDSYLDAISVEDLIRAYNDTGKANELVAAALENTAAKMRS